MPLHCQDALNKIRAGKELALGMGVHHMRGPPRRCWPRRRGSTGCSSMRSTGSSRRRRSRRSVWRRCRRAWCRSCASARANSRKARARSTTARWGSSSRMSIRRSRRGRWSMPSASRRWGIARTGGTNAQFGYRPPAAAEAQKTLNAEILIIPMIETPLAVENADAIAAIDGIDALLIGTNDLTAGDGHLRPDRARAHQGRLRDGGGGLQAPRQGARHGRRVRPGAGDATISAWARA